jgi:S-adenosylmethionine synthetase
MLRGTWPRPSSRAGWAKACEVRVAYAIGVAEPVAIDLETFGTGRMPDAEILLVAAPDAQAAFRPAAIIRRLGLRRPIYRQTAAFGHFGRDEFPWEKTVS